MGHSKRGHFWGACAKSGPARGGGRIVSKGVCVAQLGVAQLKIRGGGQHYSNIKSDKVPIKIVFCHELE